MYPLIQLVPKKLSALRQKPVDEELVATRSPVIKVVRGQSLEHLVPPGS